MNKFLCGLWIVVLILNIIEQCNGGQPSYWDVYCPLVIVILNYFERAVKE